MSDSQIPSAAPQVHPTMMPDYSQQPNQMMYPNQQQFAYHVYQNPVDEDKTPSLCTMILIRVAVTIAVTIIIALVKVFLL